MYMAKNNVSRLLTKPKKWSVCPAKTQISLGIHPVWSESLLCAHWVAKDPRFLHADNEDSDQTGRFCWFCHEETHVTLHTRQDFLARLASAITVRRLLSWNIYITLDFYTLNIYAEGYMYIVLSFHLSVGMFVRLSNSWNLPQSFPQSCIEVSWVGHILRITYQKAFIFGLWIPWKVCFHAMSFGPRVHAPEWGCRSKPRTHLKSVFSTVLLWKELMQIVSQTWLNLETLTCRSWSVDLHDLYFMVQWFCRISWRLVWTS